MKKVFIYIHSLEIGGAERSLIGLLNSIDYSEYEVDLFLSRHTGEFFNLIPENVNLLPQIKQYTYLAVPIANLIKNGALKIAFGRAIGKLKAKRFLKRNNLQYNPGITAEYSHKYTKKFMPEISDVEYDLAISFLTPHYFVSEKVNSKIKIAWIHTDYTKLSIDVDSELKMWDKYDKLVAVSDKCKESFIKIFPTLKDKVTVIENILSSDYVRSQADVDVFDEIKSEKNCVNILSVGRFECAKNFESIPEIVSKMKNNVKWYIVGYGGLEEKIRNKITEFNMEDRVIILGKKSNPYPYIKACDIYAQPSLYEGKAVTVREAQILCKPVVITNFTTAASQVNAGVDGVIIPMEIDECAKALDDFIVNTELQKKLIKNCSERNFGNENEVEKIYDLIRSNI